MVLVTTAVEFRPALHTQVSVLVMRELLRTSRGMELKGKRKGGGREVKWGGMESERGWKDRGKESTCMREREREKQREGRRER